MDIVLPLLSIVGAITLGAISPGPSFLFVTRTAIALSRRDALGAALGMGIGGAVYATLALLGLQAVLSQVGWLYLALKVLGGLYLLWLAYQLWGTAAKPLADAQPVPGSERGRRDVWRSFTLGLMTQLSNPKAAIVYGSVFAAFLPQHPPVWTFAVLIPALFAVEAGWYTIVAFVFSSAKPRAAYLASKRWADRAAGTVMGLLGIRLVLEAVRLR